MCFTIFQNEKTLFLAIKNSSSKSQKIEIFPKALTHGFGQKLAIPPSFSFQTKETRKMCFALFQNEITPMQAMKTRSLKSRKIEIFPKGLTHGFDQKLARFLSRCFQTIDSRKMCFTIFQNEKTSFQAIKTRSSKGRKNEIFLKGLTHGFGQTLAIFQSFLFRQQRPGKCVLQYSRTKKRPSWL